MRTAKLALLVLLTPLALLSACAGSPPDRAVEGVVESASVVSLSSRSPASAGGTTGAASNPRMAYRVRMPDGTTKDVVQSGERFDVGERVRITADGRLTQP
jgi:hypothetical protein